MFLQLIGAFIAFLILLAFGFADEWLDRQLNKMWADDRSANGENPKPSTKALKSGHP